MKKKILGAMAFCAVCVLSVNANPIVKSNEVAQESAVEVMQEPEEEQTEVEKLIAQNSKNLPAAVADGLVLAMMGTEEGDVVYLYKTTDAVFKSLSGMGAETCAANTLAQVAAAGLNDALTVAMVEEGYGVLYIYVNEDTEEKFMFGVSAEDFAAAALKSQQEEE